MAESISDIKGVGSKTEEALNDNGITTLEDLAEADTDEVASCGMSNSRAKDIINKAQQSTVTIQTGVEVEEEYNSKSKISSNIESLDEALEGGFYEETVVSVWGGSGSGKTQLCFDILVEAVEQTGEDAIYIETEKDRFRPERIEAISDRNDILDKIHRVKAHGLDTQYNSYGKVMEAFDSASIVVVDSLTARVRLSEEFEGRSTLGKRKSLLGKHLTSLEEIGEELNCPVLFTNQSSINPDNYGKNEIQYGGSLVQHTAKFFIHMKEGQGETHVAEVQNHPSTGNTEITVNINENGISEV